jgi:hypothetical protein
VVADTGVITIGETTLTLAVAVPEPFVATAVMVHCFGYSGAVNSPADEIDPQFVDHVDATLAVNCWVAFSFTVIPVGDTETAKAEVAFRKGRRQVERQINRRRESMGVLRGNQLSRTPESAEVLLSKPNPQPGSQRQQKFCLSIDAHYQIVKWLFGNCRTVPKGHTLVRGTISRSGITTAVI